MGLILTANLLAPLVIPILPEMLEVAEERYPDCNMQTVGDLTGALLSTSLGLGQVLGPLYGAMTYSALNFRLTQDILAIFCISFATLYFLLGDGLSAFKITLRSQKTEQTSV